VAGTVLVIDDDATARQLIRRVLAREGFRVEEAATGEAGLERARQLRPDAVTLDVLMPGMDGWAVLTALKADPELAGIPVVMLTILDNQAMGFALGAADYLTKPLDRKRLASVLARHAPAGPARTVLVVEDDAGARAMLRRALRRDGWKVIEAENGRVALGHIARQRPDLVLLDLLMPEMDGFEFLEELRKQEAGLRSPPIIVITAKDLTERDRQRLNGGVESVVRKGSTTNEALLDQLRRVVPSPRP
jgi:hypothetical protein